MQTSFEPRRLDNGAIDYDFYRSEAARLRERAIDATGLMLRTRIVHFFRRVHRRAQLILTARPFTPVRGHAKRV